MRTKLFLLLFRNMFIPIYQQHNDFHKMLYALNLIMKFNDDNMRIRETFSILLSDIHRGDIPKSRQPKYQYPDNYQIDELIRLSVHKMFKVYPSGLRSWKTKPKSKYLICDYLYDILLWWDDYLVVVDTYFWAWKPMLDQMWIWFDEQMYEEYNLGPPKEMIIPDFSKHPIFSPQPFYG